jgi:hypothetical protein
MAVWSIKPSWKKSIIERQYWSKEGVAGYIMHEIGWRWGEFTCVTEDDNPPELESGVDLFNCDYEVEMVELNDGCWEETEYDLADEEETEKVQLFLEENSVYDLEEDGWVMDECEMILDCDPEIEKLED